MKGYEPPDDDDDEPKKKKSKKDPNAPKKPKTAFLFFTAEMRPKLKSEHPELSFGDLGRKLGEMFRGLDESKKQKYEAMANDEKKRYKEKVAAYESRKRQGDGVDDDDSNDSDNDDDDDSSDED